MAATLKLVKQCRTGSRGIWDSSRGCSYSLDTEEAAREAKEVNTSLGLK